VEAIPLIAILVVAFYLLIVRPTQLRNRRAADLKAHLVAGAEIITTAGMFGRVLSVDDDEIQLEIAPGVVVRLLTGAVGKILSAEDLIKEQGDSTGEGDADSGSTPPKTL
jgi:preprotein translocase subunit YajC